MTTDKVHELIIIGSGPAGYTAAVYAARAQLAPLVFEGTQFGGALMTTTEVENYPGFTDGIMGPELMEQMRGQATRFGADLRAEDVEEVSLEGPVKTVVANGVTYSARAVILAMGAAARYLDVPGEQELLGRGVSSCATCDGFFFRDHDIAVVGGGDSAMEEATFLTRFAKSVTIVHRREDFRASRIMLERAQNDPKMRWALNSEVVGVEGEGSVSGLRLRDTRTGEERSIPATAMFVAIGHDPRSGLVEGQLELDDAGYVKVASPSTATAIPGVFACGDLVDHTYRQAITAAGSGCSAAIDAERWLAEGTVTTEMAGGGYGQASEQVAAVTG
ncbi:thioredoxin-disulfide reductase [Pseudonocardia sp. KRD-184]|uniref:Thioredoxin reductase n=1 Tax=Pseudonocardia oceani TaxID=2792013 RepID=A0ABS6U9L0_9PSEU|nr:thioredoxin-disulfide reductase [Pseudonocardia oceani]MBW0092133.1 thioredoxin-disulfide reductase [Pseudonocardia oceani]MBW0100057.1 thioredoxin-disulfide reductase [Pseudonocardia oceani]MBW0112727.1 thioredoxin-disulfide reductase [Pseudonocardia oceani]MBW0125757.1 thioredoxin-disulfide reductase [Pseudonocardia oceani]MBW0128918.1 thioredoxin-disulfide reductase [Pseudonocardia oceani]